MRGAIGKERFDLKTQLELNKKEILPFLYVRFGSEPIRKEAEDRCLKMITFNILNVRNRFSWKLQ